MSQVQMPMDYQTEKHRGFAFVEFELQEDAQAAIDNMVRFLWSSQYVEIRFSDIFDLSERLGDVWPDPQSEHGEAAAAEGELDAPRVGGRRVALQVRRAGLAAEAGGGGGQGRGHGPQKGQGGRRGRRRRGRQR